MQSILFSFITIGIAVDLLAAILMIGDYFGLTRPSSLIGRGMPIGPIFYLLGCVQLLLRTKSWSFALIVLFSCFVFYALIVFSVVIIDACIKFFRRVRACERKIFRSDSTQGVSAKDTIENTIRYFFKDGSKSTGFIYLGSPRKPMGGLIQILASGKSLIDIGEDNPGEIFSGKFASYMSKEGFDMAQWQIDKRRRVVVPTNDYFRIPDFVDILFTKYYNCREDYQIKAEGLKMS